MKQEKVPQKIQFLLNEERVLFVFSAKNSPFSRSSFEILILTIAVILLFCLFSFLLGFILRIPVEAVKYSFGCFAFFVFIIQVYKFFNLLNARSYYIAKDSELIIWNENRARIISWKNFNYNIEVSGTKEEGNIVLRRREGDKNDDYSNDIYLMGVKNPYVVVDIINERIKNSK